MANPDHVRFRKIQYRKFDHIRYSSDMRAFLNQQATRLKISAESVFFHALAGKSADEIRAIPEPTPPPAAPQSVEPAQDDDYGFTRNF